MNCRNLLLKAVIFGLLVSILMAGAHSVAVYSDAPLRTGAGPHTEVLQMTQASKGSKANQQPFAERYAGKLRIVARFLPKEFVPDGDLSKPVWKAATQVRFDKDALGRKSYPESETRVACLWSDGFVYFAYWCKYSTLNIYEGEDITKERWELWNRDVVEVFINPEPERFYHYYEFEVSPNNMWIDLEIDLQKKPFNSAAWNSGFEHATRIDAATHVWTCEMRIPAASMGVREIKANSEWRLNFYRADGPGSDEMRRFLSWNVLPTEKLSFHQPASFGFVQFKR